MSWQAKEGGGTGFDTVYPDVTYPGGRVAVASAFENKSVEIIDV